MRAPGAVPGPDKAETDLYLDKPLFLKVSVVVVNVLMDFRATAVQGPQLKLLQQKKSEN